MPLFKQNNPLCKPFTIILPKAHVYQVLLFHILNFSCWNESESGEKTHSWLHTDSVLYSWDPPWDTHNTSFFWVGNHKNVDHVNNPHACQHKLGSERGRERPLPSHSLPPKAVASLRPSSWWWTCARPGRWAWTVGPAVLRGRTRGTRTPAPPQAMTGARWSHLEAWGSRPSRPVEKTVQSHGCRYFWGLRNHIPSRVSPWDEWR